MKSVGHSSLRNVGYWEVDFYKSFFPDSSYCPTYRDKEENPEHVIFECFSFTRESEKLNRIEKCHFGILTMINMMCEAQDSGTSV